MISESFTLWVQLNIRYSWLFYISISFETFFFCIMYSILCIFFAYLIINCTNTVYYSKYILACTSDMDGNRIFYKSEVKGKIEQN